MIEIKLPELGENIEAGQVVSIMVNVGDSITVEQDLIEVETDKASLPVPATAAGVVKEILVNEGDEIKVGQVILKVEGSAAATTAAPSEPTPAAQPTAAEAPQPEPTPTQTPQASPTTHTPTGFTGEKDTEIVVLGGGPGGYAAAFLAADMGAKTTLVELDTNPGGVCLYRGCIPSKALLHAAKVLSESKDAAEFGIEYEQPKINLDKLRSWKQGIVDRLTGGLGGLVKQRKINYIQGRGSFVDSNTLKIEKSDGSEQTLTFEKCILATGSSPIKLPFLPESPKVLDSTTALEIEDIPESLLLVGGGYIGLELGTVYAELGTKVSVVEMLPNLMAQADRDIAGVLEKRLKTIYEDIMVNTKITGAVEKDNGLEVSLVMPDGKEEKRMYSKLLVAVGRRPNSKNIGLENTNVVVNDQGFIEVNGQLQTHDASISAIGDIVGNPMLAHKASAEGRVAVEAILGHKVAFEPNTIPAVVFTDPEIAWCGLTETEAKEQGRDFKVLKFPWAASGRALTLNRTDGLTKLLVDNQTQLIIGMSIVGVGAGELIAEGVVALEMGALVDDLKMSIHPHPTISETIMETAESFHGFSTHIYRPQKKK